MVINQNTQRIVSRKVDQDLLESQQVEIRVDLENTVLHGTLEILKTRVYDGVDITRTLEVI